MLSLKVTAFIILEKSRGEFLTPPSFQIGPPKKPVLLRVKVSVPMKFRIYLLHTDCIQIAYFRKLLKTLKAIERQKC